MATINIKEYTTKIKDLEIALYTQKKLMNEHKMILQEQRPKEPQPRKGFPRPTEPTKPNISVDFIPEGSGITCAIMCLGFFFDIALIVCAFSPSISLFDEEMGIFFSLLILLIGLAAPIFLFCFIKDYKDNKKRLKYENEQYKQKLEKFPALMKEYDEQDAQIKQANEKALDFYNHNTLPQYNKVYNYSMEQHKNTISLLENSLSQLYEQNIIFPKYRNLVSISVINEYLISGRCDTLEGANGAYNLYESELRQDIIIGQLSCIINNLEQIRDNQYTLYTELKQANATINDISNELRILKDDTKLIKHFTRMSILAQTAPQIIYSL